MNTLFVVVYIFMDFPFAKVYPDAQKACEALANLNGIQKTIYLIDSGRLFEGECLPPPPLYKFRTKP